MARAVLRSGACFCLAVLLLNGCVGGRRAGGKTNADLTVSVTDIGTEIDKYLKVDGLQPYVSIFADDALIVADGSFDGEGHYRQDIFSDKTEKVPFWIEEPVHVSSGDRVLIGERFLYTTGAYQAMDDSGLLERRITKTDSVGGECEIIDANILDADDRPFVYLAKLDEKRLLSCEINTQESVIMLHDSKDDSTVKLVAYEYHRVDGMVRGSILMDVCASNGRIFALVCVAAETATYHLEEFDTTGNRVNVYQSSDFSAFLESSAPVGIYSLGDYIFLRDWNSEHAVFRLSEKKLEKCHLPDNHLMFNLCSLDNYYTDQYNRYVYFYDTRTEKRQGFYAFDTKSGDWLSVNLTSDDDKKQLSRVIADEYGNVIIQYVSTMDGATVPAEESAFYVAAREMKQLLETED